VERPKLAGLENRVRRVLYELVAKFGYGKAFAELVQGVKAEAPEQTIGVTAFLIKYSIKGSKGELNVTYSGSGVFSKSGSFGRPRLDHGSFEQMTLRLR
jgi:hypothetical protein